MARTTRSSVKQEEERPEDAFTSANEMQSEDRLHGSSPSAYRMQTEERTIPRRPSRAPSAGITQPNGTSVPSSGSTVRDEDIDMMNGGTGIENDASRAAQQQNNGSQSYRTPPADAMETIGQSSRQLIKTIQKLEALRIDATLSSLPKFVVVGDQSHGKSSIIEAICGITLPRNAGTCTRCPFQITTTTSKDSAWSCNISLVYQYSWQPTGGPRSQHHWVDTKAQRIVDFASVTDKKDLERALRLSQVAILNPQIKPQDLCFANEAALPTKDRHSFSKNVIRLDIYGPELPELSMYDLPGCINVHEEDQGLVGFIESLTKDYASDPQALILLAVSADQDVETSTAFRVIHGAGARPRTMGVLTKADLLTSARQHLVQSVLSGSRFKLGQPWYVTKHSSQDELEKECVTHEEARKRESIFFANEPWSTDFGEFTAHFGTYNVQAAISNLLVNHIKEELPDIIDRVQTRLEDVTNELRGLPARPHNPCSTVRTEVQKLRDLVVDCIQNRETETGTGFYNEFKGLLRKYKAQFQALRPYVDMTTPGYQQPAIALDSSDEEPVETPSSKKRKTNAGKAAAATPTPTRGNRGSSQTPRVNRETLPTPATTIFTLDKIHQELDRSSDSNLIESSNSKVNDKFVKMSFASWEQITNHFLARIKQLVSDMLRECVQKSVANRGRTELLAQVLNTIRHFCDVVCRKDFERVLHTLDCNMGKADSYVSTKELMKNAADELRGRRESQRATEYFDTAEANGSKAIPLDKRVEQAKNRDWMQKTLGEDEYADAAKAMKFTLFYYDLCSSRVHDSIAMLLHGGFLPTIQRDIQETLLTSLNVDDVEYCARLLAGDPTLEEKRVSLFAEKEKLTQALNELEALPTMMH